MNRRNWIKGLGAMAAFGTLPNLQSSAQPISPFISKRILRIAHLTDIHLQHDKGAPAGLIKCLHHLQNLNPVPDIIFNGGDTIDDALMHTKSHVQKEWDLWHSIIKNECALPVEHCIGNHDVWGLITEKSDSLYGKKFALEMMELDNPYRSFDLNGWHFIVLDSTQEKENGLWYTAKLGDEQMEWLRKDLEQTPADSPVMILSHIPVLSATVFFDGDRFSRNTFHIPGKLMHSDVKEILQVLSPHKNVKLCLSGHIHLYDHVEYNGISFYCNGAVCGDWWDHTHYHETEAGYAIVDLYDDGTFTNQYVAYGSGVLD